MTDERKPRKKSTQARTKKTGRKTKTTAAERSANKARSNATLAAAGFDPRAMEKSLDLSAWGDERVPGWILAYAFRLCDPNEDRHLKDIEAELHIGRTQGWKLRTDPRFKDIMLQLHELMLDTAFVQVFRRTTRQALDGNIEAEKLFYDVTGKRGTHKAPGRVPLGADPPAMVGDETDIDSFDGESEAYLEQLITEQLDLIRRRRLAGAIDGSQG